MKILIPASDTTEGVDAYGNEIDNPRVNSSVVNLTGDNYARTPAAAILDTVKTVSGWFYYNGSTEQTTILTFGSTGVATASGVIFTDAGVNTTWYINGVKTNSLGAAGWKHYMVTSTAALVTADWDQLKVPQARLRAYTDVKTLSDALQNYNADRADFGVPDNPMNTVFHVAWDYTYPTGAAKINMTGIVTATYVTGTSRTFDFTADVTVTMTRLTSNYANGVGVMVQGSSLSAINPSLNLSVSTSNPISTGKLSGTLRKNIGRPTVSILAASQTLEAVDTQTFNGSSWT
jgi:hypothetical protein